MKFLICAFCLINYTFLISQIEEISPLTSNPYVVNLNLASKIAEKSATSFDSTFIFLVDTLQLPIFDEFSKNKFQELKANFSDPDVTQITKYHLLNLNLSPLDHNASYSSLPSIRRVYSADHLSYTDLVLPIIPIKIGELNSYPVNYVNTNVYPAYFIYDSLGITNDIPDTVYIANPDIVQDSAVQFFKNINNPNLIWTDNFVYRNYRFAKNPWSIGVATFDGLDENGFAYELGSNITDYADYLTSKPIDLSLKNPSDSIYLSFLYQAGGFGETPDETDSLVLEFYVKNLDQWVWAWSTKGTMDTNFNVGHICLKNTNYFEKGFKFRFKNYGNKSGGFDHFHLDYVNLRALSGQQDTLFKDYAWVYPINSLLKDYTSVPWDHFKNNPNGKMSNSVNTVIRNGSNIPENNSTDGKVEIRYNNNLETTFNISGNSLSAGSLNYEPRTFYSTLHDFSTGYHFDETKTGTKAEFEVKGVIGAQFPNLNQNDTTFSKQYFGNYYSYDDGTAEAAYGIIGSQAFLAIKYTPYESDSIIGISTNFVQSATNVSDKLFLLTVWAENEGKPGNLLYIDQVYFPRNPIYNFSINKFYTYYFNENQKVKVDGSFYIGWKQLSAERLNIGFDKNNINNDKTFLSLDNGVSWINSTIEGTIMMRPIFSTEMNAELGVKKIEIQKGEIGIYPNPTNDIINIQSISGEYLGIDIYSLHGKHILSSEDLQINISDYSSGIYLLKTKGNNPKTYKIIKK